MIDKVKINIGGQLFITKRNTIQRFPGTKLSNITETCDHFDKTSEEYYFDRNPLIFQSILDYYRTGKLHFVTNVCAEHIRDELDFWEISTSDLGPCCWKYFYAVDNDLKTVGVIEKHFVQQECTYIDPMAKVMLKDKIWNILEHPKTSTVAMVWQLFYLAIVCLAIVVVIVQSFEITRHHEAGPGNATLQVKERLMDQDDWVLFVTHICNIIFAGETILRYFTCPNKFDFLKGFLNIIDIVSSTGYLILVFVRELPDYGTDFESVFVFAYIMTVLRGFRFYRIERFIEELRLMFLSIKESKKMLCLLIAILLITSLVFGIMIHVMEMDGKFSDPISCLYWAIITMTTIGYGDIYPKSYQGKIIGSACATVGLFLLAMPIAVVGNTFNDLHNRHTERHNHLEVQKRFNGRKQTKYVLFK